MYEIVKKKNRNKGIKNESTLIWVIIISRDKEFFCYKITR
jgi:hypothetical protein